eukprot:TRINITY_DN12286_c0_g2_i5.p1 TRINITY_DN12286_c0_g2~~TRINITY_DN12286_c0_g2_i5.p1  ORF type:complete len:368 (+),score=121.06 TRINITY_DN12286_c0_g2_i5:61-1104(+)
MNPKITIFLLLISGATCDYLTPEYIEKFVVKMWQDYKGGYRKEYEGAGVEGSEDHKKMLVFKEGLLEASKQMDKNEGTTFGFTMYTDMTDEDFKTFTHGNVFAPTPSFPKASIEDYQGKDPTGNVDRRRDMTVSHIKHQLGTALSGAFAATGAIEGAYAAKGPILRPLSEEWIVSCAAKDCSVSTTENCSPGALLKAVVEAGGKVPLEEDYEFAKGSACAFDPSTMRYGAEVTEILSLENNPAFLKKWIVKNGAFAASVSNVQDWKTYQQNVVFSTCGGDAVAAVTIIGFGEHQGREYWLAKNSWGTVWGENGTIKLDMDSACLIDPIAVKATGLTVEPREENIPEL